MSGGGTTRFVARLLDGAARGAARPLPDDAVDRPAVLFSPHQDDESLGCGGLVALKRRRGVPVTVVFVADGGGSHAGRIPAADLVARRREEALDACGVLGVARDEVLFLDLPDLHLQEHEAEGAARMAQILAARPEAQVLVPFRHDRTPDHVATHRMARRALAGGGPRSLLEYAVWFWHHWPVGAYGPTGAGDAAGWAGRTLRDWWRRFRLDRMLLLDDELLGIKRRALACHVTQMRRPPGDDRWPVLSDVADGRWLAACLSGHECYRSSVAGGDPAVERAES